MRKILFVYSLLASPLFATEEESEPIVSIPDQKMPTMLQAESNPHDAIFKQTKSQSKWIHVSTYSGYISGRSEELVYAQTEAGEVYKMSHLDWKIRNLWIFGGTIQADFSSDRGHLYLDAWNKITSSEAIAVDRDWLDEKFPSKNTHISWSPSYLTQANGITVESKLDFFKMDRGFTNLNFGLLFGYQLLYFGWEDFGGTFSYDEGGEKPDLGRFEDCVGISYIQKFSIPYFGLQINWEWNKMLQAALFGKFSSIAHILEEDIHFLRDTIFEDEFYNGQYWITGASIHWTIRRYLLCDLKYEYAQLNKTYGNMLIKTVGEEPFMAGGSGVFHNHQTLKLGLTAVF